MAYTWFFILLQIAAIACAMVAGVFLTFSDFVMRSLGGSRAEAGVEVMQMINREVWRTVFMSQLIGMLVLSPFLIGYAHFYVDGIAAVLIIAGAVTYLLGVGGVSRFFNIPMNDKLESMDYTGEVALKYWTGTYVKRWTHWNNMRVIASATSAVCFLIASAWRFPAG